MDAQNTEIELEDEARVHFAPSDDESLHYKTEDAQRRGFISAKSIIAIDRRNSLGWQVLYAAPIQQNDKAAGDSPVALKRIYIHGLPEDAYPSMPSLSTWFDSRSHVDVFISTRSGTGLAEGVWKQLIEPAFTMDGRHLHEQYGVFFTTSETTISELTRDRVLTKANKGESQTILLLSGDGGMVDMINTLIAGPRLEQYQKPEIGLLPFGTGNALANSSGITGDDTFGFRALLQGRAKEVPVFRATFSPGARLLTNEGQEERELDGSIGGSPVTHGAVVCSWGLHATLVADSDTTEYRKFGVERFKMAGKEALYPSDGSLPHAYKGKVSVSSSGSSDWKPWDRDEHGYVLATPVSHLEAGFHISPSSKSLDGKLRLVHFGRLSGGDAMGIMTKAYQDGQHVHEEQVGYEEIDGLRIDFAEDDARWRRVCVDGKIIRVEKGGWVEVKMCESGVVDLLAK